MSSIKVEEKTLVNLLERFVENSPEYRSINRTVNQRFDATSLTKKTCNVYLPDIDFDKDSLEEYPTEVKYQINMTLCYGIELQVKSLDLEHPYDMLGYFDDVWCWGENKKTKYDRGRTLNDKMNKLILHILEVGNYKEHISYEDDYYRIID